MRKSKIYPNVLDTKVINAIKLFCDKRDVAHNEVVDNRLWSVNKTLDIQDENSFLAKLLLPKIKKILGLDIEFDMGCHKVSTTPYGTHVDSANNARYEHVTKFHSNEESTHHLAVLIPLSESPGIRTITFNIFDSSYSGMCDKLPAEWLTSSHSLDPKDFSHIVDSEDITRLPVDIDYTWKIGDIFTWPREQLHSSANFLEYGLPSKEFLIIFSK